MNQQPKRAIAIVGLGAILPDAPNVEVFWDNLLNKHDSITETPADRWKIEDYYNPDPSAPDKTYSKIGGWVKGYEFDWKTYRVPPKVAGAMDQGQQWAVSVASQVLQDYGFPQRPIDPERVGVILGTAMGGELHYRTYLRTALPEVTRALRGPIFSRLPPETQAQILDEFEQVFHQSFPPITEDTMPGELPNIVSGRVANLLNLRGPNYITDAACASSLAAVQSAMGLLESGIVDTVITGGVDRNMGASTFIKFSKIGALSATGSRPFAYGADGFVMGEGAAAFLLKRLEDAERDGDRIYAVIRGVGAASDGRGKGITAPNPAGQQLAMRRAWQDAGLDPASAALIEAHGTSTRVGDMVEVESLAAVFCDAPTGRIALGSVKSNLGHLKAAAGAAGLLKATLALYRQILPPTMNASVPNPQIDFNHSPFYLNTETGAWPEGSPRRRCGVSAYGFGGTNFHLVLEEYIPGLLTNRRVFQAAQRPEGFLPDTGRIEVPIPVEKLALRGILALGGETVDDLRRELSTALKDTAGGREIPGKLPSHKARQSWQRLVIDYSSQSELVDKLKKAEKALIEDAQPTWNALQAQGIFRGQGKQPGKIAFLFPGQGSQYINMGRDLIQNSPEAAQVFAQADRRMELILGNPLSSYILVDSQDPETLKQAEHNLTQTAITQPAVLTVDIALARMLDGYGIHPDIVMGHSLGEYAALEAAGIMPFDDVLEAAAARGSEMSKVKVGDNGCMAAVMAPIEVVEASLKQIDGYVVIANLNSFHQCVIGGASRAVQAAISAFNQAGYQAVQLPVSHAFHTRIVAPASRPLRQVLDRLHIRPPCLPIVSNVSGEFYPRTVEGVKDILEKQVASPVQWIKGLETLYAAGVRVFVEVGPKKALKSFVEDIFNSRPEVVALYTNHPKTGELASFNQALCGLYAAGIGAQDERPYEISNVGGQLFLHEPAKMMGSEKQQPEGERKMETKQDGRGNGNGSKPDVAGLFTIESMSQVVSQTVRQVLENLTSSPNFSTARRPYDRNQPPLGSIVITGTGLGLPGTGKAVMDPDNADRILRGEQFVDLIPERFRKGMLAKRITRLVKAEDGGGTFQSITDVDEVIKLAGRRGSFDPVDEYGIPAKLVEALDITTQLAMAAGLDALREAAIPLVQVYRKTTTGKYLPDRWMLPDSMRDDTGVIFASAFPGNDRLCDEFTRYYTYQNRLDQRVQLEELRTCVEDPTAIEEIVRRINALNETLRREPYEFDRRFLFRVLSMGHSQFAEYIGARGPNTQVNAACASTTQAIGLAEDWIRGGRCRRVIVIAADDVSDDHLMEWVGAGFLATGAAAIDDRVDQACLPFDRRRHGMVVGMGACALVVESEDAARERGVRGIVELLASETNNSAYHGTRLDVDHIASVMETLVSSAELRFNLSREVMAPYLVFMSHETFTPARGGSASAEIMALKRTFGDLGRQIVIANTKGLTGHAMGVGVEDVIALKILERGIVPPVPNFKEVDDELGELNLSRGGHYPVLFALHLAAGFGSQIAMTLTRRIPGGPERVNQPVYQSWLANVSGYNQPETEVVKRTLRIKSNGTPERLPCPNSWRRGTEPVQRASTASTPDMVAPSRYVARTWLTHGSGNDHEPEKIAIHSEETVETYNPVSVVPPPEFHEPARPGIVLESQPESADGISQAPAAVIPKAEPVSQAKASNLDPIRENVLDIVAAKTGYPKEMLELDLDLEADLGIDTVKQAETFMAIRQSFDIPKQENLRLRDYPTLGCCIQFVRDMRPDLAARPELSVAETGSTQVEPAVVSQTEPIGQENAPGRDSIREKVLDIVAAMTGYPKEMLELDLDLEADLGIDTVKQAETFMAIRQSFDIPKQENLRLRDYPTLGRCIQFVRDMRPDLAAPAIPASAVPAGVEKGQPESQSLAPFPHPFASPTPAPLEAADQVARRVPVPCLRPALDLCKPTGIQLGKDSRVVIAMDQGGVGKSLAAALKKLKVTVLELDPDLAQAVLEKMVEAWCAGGPVQGVYWLPALDSEPDMDQLDLAAWQAHNQRRVFQLAAVMKLLYEQINRSGTFLVAGTRLGGLHGYGPAPARGPLGGAVTGFTKAYRREQPQALVKVVDFEFEAKAAVSAEALLAETFYDPSVVEIGYWQDGRCSITLIEQPAADGQPGLKPGKDSVFVVTGAAGSITTAIIADLAAASSGTFYLMDLALLPDLSDPYVTAFRKGRETLKRMLIDESLASGVRLTPAHVEKQISRIERQEAALRAVESVNLSGGTAIYRCLDLTDDQAVKSVIEEVRQKFGRIDAIIHAAGIEISRSLGDKDLEQFRKVFEVKATGCFNLLLASKGMPLGALVVFSSVAGRFGNSGQTDYAAANDLMCKLVSGLPTWRPGTRGIAIDWTAWDKIGMATRGSIPQMMSMAGIEMLSPEAGIPTVRRELVSGGRSGELVVAGKLGILDQELDETGGLDGQKATAWLDELLPRPRMLTRLVSAPLNRGLNVETCLDPKEQPFLRDHQMEGVPLLPGVMGAETFAELASVAARAAGFKDFKVTCIENIHFDAPFKFYHQESQILYLSILVEPQAAGELLAHATLSSRRAPKRKGLAEHGKQHFTADIRLSRRVESAPSARFEIGAGDWEAVEAGEIYQVFFHGPAYQVLSGVRLNGQTAIGQLAESLPPDFFQPAGRFEMAPRLLELCLQTAGIWEFKRRGMLALPRAIGQARVFEPMEELPAGLKIYALVNVQADPGPATPLSFDAQVVDEQGMVYAQIYNYETIALPKEGEA